MAKKVATSGAKAKKKLKSAEREHIRNRKRIQTAEGWKRSMEKIKEQKKREG